jgi:protein O-GlcNAc transferase
MHVNSNRVFEQDRYQKLFEKGAALWASGAIPEAKSVYKQILRDKPTHSETLRYLALIIRKEGQLGVARDMLERAIRSNPLNYAALSHLGNLLIETNDLDEARKWTEKALAIAPDYSEVPVNLGLLAMRAEANDEAIAHFERALAIAPDSMVAQMNLATCRRRLLPPGAKRNEVAALTEAVEKDPDNPRAQAMLAFALEAEGRTSRALVHAYRANQLDPNANNLSKLASIMCSLGDFDDAIPLFRRGVELAPYDINNVSAFLFAMNYNPLSTEKELFDLYSGFVEKFLKPQKKFRHLSHPKIAGRKIKIGYSSPDFREHALFYFISLIFSAHDRENFELFAYSNAEKFDGVSETIRNSFDHWIDVSQMPDEKMAQKIREDGIDVLVDLAGHTNRNRLGTFAMRPAPVQVSYLGYGCTTGLRDIDYFIGDENLTPEECDPYFSEAVWRVPAPAYAYRPPPAANVDVAPLPALRNGYVTFGSMSRLIRLNNAVLAAWKAILDRVPMSRLRLDALQLSDSETRDLFVTRLRNVGFEPGQLELGVTTPHWNGYAAFDISLDCWPHNTGTTTLDSLWMGVPVVSKMDRPSVGRFGAAFLRPVGLDDWLVEDVPAYIEKAVAAASDLPALSSLRASLRDRLLASPLMRERLMAEKLETMYRQAMLKFEQGNR